VDVDHQVAARPSARRAAGEPTGGLDPIAQQEFQTILEEHASVGGSVLLSSHILGEVQRVAHRIGVLRAGRLVAVERLDVLRGRSLHQVRVSFARPVDTSAFAGVDGLRDVTASTTR